MSRRGASQPPSWVHSSLLSFLAISNICCLSDAASSNSSGQSPGTCISQGGRFPRYAHDGQLPKKSTKGPNDLTLCRIYTKRTCCTSLQTRAALNSLRMLASNGEANSTCLSLWEVLECSICDPRVGTQPGPPILCNTFCESVFTACANAFFAVDPTSQVLMPCGPRDVLCARGEEWAINASTFCKLLGFSVPSTTELIHEHAFCFEGKTEVESKGSASTTHRATRSNDGSLRDDFLVQVGQMDMGEKVLWAIGGLVLTAAAACWRHRRAKSKQKRAALFRSIQEARARQQAASNLATRKAANRTPKKL